MAVSNQLAANAGRGTFSSFIGKREVSGMLANALRETREIQKFTSSICSAVSTNPELQGCDYATVLSAGLLANALNLSLSPQLGFCYVVPFNDKKRESKVATFVLGYKGYIQLAIRSGYYKKLNVTAIKEGELVRYDPLTEEIEIRQIEDEEEREKAPTAGYYAMFEYVGGFRKAIYWSKKKMMLHADKYSSAFSLSAYRKLEEGEIPKSEQWKYSSFWYKDFDGMAYKTMLRQLISKWGIMSIDMQNAFEKDEKVVKVEESNGAENGGISFGTDYDGLTASEKDTQEETSSEEAEAPSEFSGKF